MKKLIGLMKSKTFWVNILGIGGVIVNEATGELITPEHAGIALAVLNIILRIVTKKPLEEK
jgi:hypothetical protein